MERVNNNLIVRIKYSSKGSFGSCKNPRKGKVKIALRESAEGNTEHVSFSMEYPRRRRRYRKPVYGNGHGC